jgi:CRISPR-associated protein Cmr3
MPTTQNAYLLHPRSPLVFGTGKPLDFGLGGDSLSFPFPSTVAGAVRAAAEVKAGRAADPYRGREHVAIGPTLLVRLNDARLKGAVALLPRPADAVYIGGHVVPLKPRPVPADQFTDLPDGLQMLALEPSRADVSAKPDEGPPWWTADEFSAWLESARESDASRLKGDKGPACAARTHVVIERFGKGAQEKGLFRTTGQDFGPRGQHGEYAILVHCTCCGLEDSARRLGGEGRFVRFSAGQGVSLPSAPGAAKSAGSIRFVLITPAIFEKGGWRPDWLQTSDRGLSGAVPGTDIVVTLTAAAIPRAQSYSGWQCDSEGRAGPGRPWRVVPAGSVYWFDIVSGSAERLHLHSLCAPNWQRDGWGYGVIGAA